MPGVNKVILIGNLGKDPEVRYLEGGIAVANFPIATTETFRDKNGKNKNEQTEWHQIVLWRRLAEVAEKYCHKGQMVYLEGKIRSRTWEDKDGNKRYTTEIFGDVLTILSRRDEQTGFQQRPQQNTYGQQNATGTYTPNPQQEAYKQQQESVNINPEENPNHPAILPDSPDDLPF